MKKLTLFVLLAIGFTCYGQDSINPICKERGHVKGDTYMATDMYCPPYIQDSKDTTWLVYPACNYITYTCIRCGKVIEEQEKGGKKVVWTRPITMEAYGVYCDSCDFLFHPPLDVEGFKDAWRKSILESKSNDSILPADALIQVMDRHRATFYFYLYKNEYFPFE